ncbi:serine/arginine-rich splicing factor 2 [Patella vulgata]|uniref:serine/arginine-rich splicing factor 2 n=1 Tax=Patella vulgata TaxID=6465 RepID=UPI00217F28D5|nr:serine/arginine-rich splicing factor 2 [Patella vulgata]
MSYGRGPPKTEGMTSLKVDNLTYRTRPEDLRRSFDKYGDVGDVYIPRDRFTKESRGFAFVRFYDKRDAEDAMDAMDGAMMDGRELRVQMARYGRPSNSRGYNDRRRNNYGGHGGGGGGGRSRNRSRSRSRSRDRYSRRRRSHSRSKSRSRSRSKSRSRSVSRSKSRTPKSEPRQSRSRSPSKSPDRSPKDNAEFD